MRFIFYLYCHINIVSGQLVLLLLKIDDDDDEMSEFCKKPILKDSFWDERRARNWHITDMCKENSQVAWKKR